MLMRNLFAVGLYRYIMSMIYSLVSREQVVLTDYTPHQGNFPQIALDVPQNSQRSLLRPTFPKHSDNMLQQTIHSTPTSKNGTSFWSWSSQAYIFSDAV